MSDLIRALLYLALAFIAFFSLWFEVSKANPCSVWADKPSECTAKLYR